MSKTLTYYNANATSFATSTKSVDFSEVQSRFLSFLPPQAKILDFGCGSGRDTKAFLEKGYQVEAIDGSVELCKLATEYTGIPVTPMLFQDLDKVEQYDGIWACSSILHLPYEDLVSVMKKIARALKQEGYFYTSFKYGTFEGERNGRYFTDMDEDKLHHLLQQTPEFRVEETWMTGDVRPGRGEEKWLNIILQKK